MAFKIDKKIITIMSLIVLAIITRLLPHPPNVAPITGVALFSAVHFDDKRLAFFIPLIGLLLSDIFLGFHLISLFVYISFFMIILMGLKFKSASVKNIFSCSTLFFIVTNFGVWLIGYPHTLQGLLTCYSLAIPFFINTFLGDLVFTGGLFYSFKYIKNRYLLITT